MLSKKSYFKCALLRDDLRRYSPVWICATIALFLLTTSIQLSSLSFTQEQFTYSSSSYYSAYSLSNNIHWLLSNTLTSIIPVCSMIYAAVVAMALLSYLYQSRSALCMHALPTTRTELFLSHYCAGLTMAVLPLLLFMAVTLPITAFHGCFTPLAILEFCLCTFGMYLFFFSFAFFCGMFTGQLWGLPLFYAIFNVFFVGNYFIFTVLAERFLYGYHESEGLYNITTLLTPVMGMSTTLNAYARNTPSTDTALEFISTSAFMTIGCYALVGILFAFLALQVFHRRQLESAGEIVSVSIFRPIFVICLGVYLGFGIMLLFCDLFYVYSFGPMLFWLFVGTLVGFCAGKMLIEKTIAIYNWHNTKHFFAVFIFALIILGSVHFDWLGYQSFVPAQEDVDRVELTLSYYVDSLQFNAAPISVTTPDDIETVRNTQAALLADYTASGAQNASEYDNYSYLYNVEIADITSDDSAIVETDENSFTYGSNHTRVTFCYTLTSGQKITRVYYLYAHESELAREGSPANILEPLINDLDPTALLTEYRTQFSVGMYNDTSDYLSSDAGTDTAMQTVDALLADIEEGNWQPSLLPKYYALDPTCTLTLTMRNNHKNANISYLYFYMNPPVGSYTEAYLYNTVT